MDTMLILDLIGWILWCALHSLLISESWTAWWSQHAGKIASWHRLLYVGYSILSLSGLMFFHRSVPTTTLFHWAWPWSLLQWIGLATAFTIFWVAGRHYDQSVFFGIAQIKNRSDSEKSGQDDLCTSGILGKIRHPYYTASFLLLLFLGNPTVTDLFVRGILALYLIIGTRLEERKLLRLLGDRYLAYQKATPMYLPRWPFRGLPRSSSI